MPLEEGVDPIPTDPRHGEENPDEPVDPPVVDPENPEPGEEEDSDTEEGD